MARSSTIPHIQVYTTEYDYIIHLINIDAILPKLFSQSCITQKEFEVVQRTLKNEGPTSAAEWLLSEILLRKPDEDSFHTLIESLVQSKQYTLAERLQEKHSAIAGTSPYKPVALWTVPNIASQSLGQFRVDKIGGGNNSNVYKGKYNGTDVAVKEINIPPRSQIYPDYRKAYMREIDISARIRHPCVVQLMGYGIENTSVLIMYDFVSGHNLEEIIICKKFKLTEYQKIEIARQVISAIAYLHESDPTVIHGDIKPGNILIADTGFRAKLCDMGCSKLKARNSKTTTDCTIKIGTVGYMAPEEILHCKATTVRTDMFSLGVTLVEHFIQEEYWKFPADVTAPHIEKYVQDHMKRGQVSPQVDKLEPTILRKIIGSCLEYDQMKRITGVQLAKQFGEVFSIDSQKVKTMADAQPQVQVNIPEQQQLSADFHVYQSQSGNLTPVAQAALSTTVFPNTARSSSGTSQDVQGVRTGTGYQNPGVYQQSAESVRQLSGKNKSEQMKPPNIPNEMEVALRKHKNCRVWEATVSYYDDIVGCGDKEDVYLYLVSGSENLATSAFGTHPVTDKEQQQQHQGIDMHIGQEVKVKDLPLGPIVKCLQNEAKHSMLMVVPSAEAYFLFYFKTTVGIVNIKGNDQNEYVVHLFPKCCDMTKDWIDQKAPQLTPHMHQSDSVNMYMLAVITQK